MGNNRIISIIIGVCCLACPAFVFADLNSDSYSRIYTRFSGSDLYHYRVDGEYQRYLVSASTLLGYTSITGEDSINVEYSRGIFAGQYGHLSEPEDFLKLQMPSTRLQVTPSWKYGKYHISPSFSVGDGFGAGLRTTLPGSGIASEAELHIQQQNAEITWQVGNEGGYIPFAWNLARLDIHGKPGKYTTHAGLYGIFPGKADSTFDNRINGMGVAFDLHGRIKNDLHLHLNSFIGQTKMRLLYRNELYGKLDNFRIAYMAIGLQKRSSHFERGIRLNACVTGSDDDTYIDIWPFTFWDTFLASRTRLKKLQMYLISPELSLCYRWGQDKDTGMGGSMSITYNHLYHHEDVIHKNRIVILYPFFYGYETFHYNWHDEVDACLRLPLQLSYRFAGGNIELNLLQVLPFSWSKLLKSSGHTGPSDPDAAKTSTWGGTTASLMLNLFL